MRNAAIATLVVLCSSATLAAEVPGGLDLTCDVDTGAFRRAADGSPVVFRLWTAEVGGTQIGSDYPVPEESLRAMRAKTTRYGDQRPRKFTRIEATIGSDASPVALDPGDEAWLEIVVAGQTFTCDFASVPSKPRRRLHSVAFAQRAPVPPTEGPRIVAGTVHSDNCTPLTDPNIPGTCDVIAGEGFTVNAYLATDAGADCCGLPGCGRCLIRYEVVFDEPFSGTPVMQVTPDDGLALTHCSTLNQVSASSVWIGCSSGFGQFVPPHFLHVTAIGPR